MSSGVRFIRVRGRIVPIKDGKAGSKSGDNKSKAPRKPEAKPGVSNVVKLAKSQGATKNQARSVSNFATAGALAGIAGSQILGGAMITKSKTGLGKWAGVGVMALGALPGAVLGGGAAGALRARSLGLNKNKNSTAPSAKPGTKEYYNNRIKETGDQAKQYEANSKRQAGLAKVERVGRIGASLGLLASGVGNLARVGSGQGNAAIEGIKFAAKIVGSSQVLRGNYFKKKSFNSGMDAYEAKKSSKEYKKLRKAKFGGG